MTEEATKAGRVQTVDNDGKILGGSVDNPVFVEEHTTSIYEGDIHLTDVCVGSNNAIGAGPFVILANCVAVQPSAGVQMEAVSTSADDTLLGSGIQKLKIEYFTESPWEYHTEVVEMDGATPVNTAATDIYRITDAVTLYAQIDQYAAFFERAIFYVQTGYQAIVTDIILGCSTNGGVKWRLFKSQEDEDTGDVVTRGRMSVSVADAAMHIPLNIPVKVSNPNGKRIAIGLAVQGKVANQEGIGTIRGFCKEIST